MTVAPQGSFPLPWEAPVGTAGVGQSMRPGWQQGGGAPEKALGP